MEPNKPNIRVLLIDDDTDDHLIVRRLLGKISASPFELSVATSYDEGLQVISQQAHDIYLVDYRLGAQTGLELLEVVEPQKHSEPFIILTGAGDERIEQQAMKLGASDYLVKGSFNAELLSRTLRYAMQRKRMEALRLQHLIDVNRAKDEFISLASHQLRTPATAVKQYLGMVIGGYVGELNDSQKTMLETAYSSNERQLQIVSDLLRVAKVDAGRVRLTKTTIDLAALVEEVIEELDPKFRQHNQKIVFVPPKVRPCAVVDKENFRMVLENIVDNASKYSGPDTTVTIRLRHTPTQVGVSIADQGVGIKAEDQDKLFIKFSRVDNPLSTEVGGSGLGLYWAKKIVDLHNGTITVTSTEGKGAAFTILLPQ
jgi:two-component system sensor histidine kinase/response regulator